VLDYDIPIIQFGIRSFAKEEYEIFYKGNPSFEYNELLFKNNVMFIRTWENLKKALTLFKNKSYSFYISLDIDVFDPSFAPGTGTPEAGGINPLLFLDFIKYLKTIKINLVGFDIVEVNPLLDTSNITSALASKIIREILVVMQE
jgi:agmatinase